MAVDPIFGTTLLEEGTNQAELLVNEMLGRIIAGSVRVNSFGDNTPPGSPANFDAYIIGSSGTGAWNTFDNDITVYLDGWKFFSPEEGNRVLVADTDVVIEFDGTNWTAIRGTQALSDAANVAWDCSLGNVATLTLGGNRTLDNPTNTRSGQLYSIRVAQDGTAGRTLAFGSEYDFVGGAAPTISTALGDVDFLTFVRVGSKMIIVSVSTQIA